LSEQEFCCDWLKTQYVAGFISCTDRQYNEKFMWFIGVTDMFEVEVSSETQLRIRFCPDCGRELQ